jgi:hypothetical protein
VVRTSENYIARTGGENINFSRNQETLTETAILGINKTLHTDK